MPLFSRKKDKSKKNAQPVANGIVSQKPKWEDSWLRTRVDPDEVADLLHGCTQEIKSRALDVPFLLLPFRPSSDPSASRTFIRNYFFPPQDRPKLTGDALVRELRMTEPMILVSVMKWCWARLPGGVVTWEVYQGFKIGEKESRFSRNSFNTFIPIGVESKARTQIINDFFHLLASLAAHGKSNGLGGHTLSRLAGWWAFGHFDTGKGFNEGYASWSSAANATSHLFFAYLRSQTPEPGRTNGILGLPRSLQQLLDATEYPPTKGLVAYQATKVVMVVDVVSPTPYALLRRAKNFEYRDDDAILQRFSELEDPVQALTEECKRVLRAISATNQSNVSDAQTSTSLADPSWSRFEDVGFSSTFDEAEGDGLFPSTTSSMPPPLSSASRSQVRDLNRPTTPSWADFLSSGFNDENGNKAPAPVLLSPDKALPPLGAIPRGQSSQSYRRELDTTSKLEPGELASITHIDIDDAFWWVWISSLAGEEPTSRKAVFGRCAVIETALMDGHWLVIEEQVKGAAPEPVPGAYMAEKKGFLSFTRRGLTRRRSGLRKSPLSTVPSKPAAFDPTNRLTLAADQQAKIQEAAAELKRKNQAEEAQANGLRRGRTDDDSSIKTNSVLTLGPMIKDEASPALQWTKQYDKKALRSQYLGNELAGKGSMDFLTLPTNGLSTEETASTLSVNKELPQAPKTEAEIRPKDSATSLSAGDEALKQPPTPKTVEPSSGPPAVVAPQPSPAHQAALAAAIPKKLAPAVEIRRSQGAERPRTERSNNPPVTAMNKPSGIKRLFGTIRKNKDFAGLPTPASPTDPDPDPAIAAARRALEGEPAQPGDQTSSPPLTPNHFAKLKQANAAKAGPVAGAEMNPSPLQQNEMSEAETREEVVEHVPETEASLAPNADIQTTEDQPIPLRTRGDEDLDQLSHVDTNERDHAGQEFSRFDQGPLNDQPAFTTTAAPVSDGSYTPEEEETETPVSFEPPHRPQHQSVYSTVTVETDATEDGSELMKQNTLDRWAQIRKNAAERAAYASGEHTRSRTEARTTDDGETSGEETIESRVARIKARVAELTGNMENTRR